MSHFSPSALLDEFLLKSKKSVDMCTVPGRAALETETELDQKMALHKRYCRRNKGKAKTGETR